MKALDVGLVRALQLLVLTFFTIVVLLWYGCVLLIPLALWLNLTEVLSLLFGWLPAALLSLAVIAGLGMHVFSTPRLLEAFLGTGSALIDVAVQCVRRIGGNAPPLTAMKKFSP